MVIPVGFLEAVAVFQSPSPGGPAMVVTAHANPTDMTASEAAYQVAFNGWKAASSFLQQMDQSYILYQVNTYLNTGGTDLAVGIWAGSYPGLKTGTGAPPQIAVLVNKTSGLAGRRNRGRMYVPGVNSIGLGEDGVIGEPAYTDWQTAANTFLSTLEQNGLPMVILHQDVGVNPTPVVSLNVQALCATQRRRIR